MMNDEAAEPWHDRHEVRQPLGLDAEGLYSTAWDLAMMGRVALDDPFMMRMSTTLSYKPQWDGPALKTAMRCSRPTPAHLGSR